MRPNARINDARKAQAARKAGGPVLPPVVMSRIAEAGASAYQWRDEVLMNLYLPPKSIRVSILVAFVLLHALTGVFAFMVGFEDSLGLAFLALAVPIVLTALGYIIFKRLSAPPALSWVGASVVAAIPMISSASWGVLGLIVLALAVFASAERERPVRAEVSAWSTALLTLLFGALSHATEMAWGVPLGWAVALIAVQVPICVMHRSFRTANHRITPDDLTTRIPPPEFKWEPLAEFVRKTARTMETIPGVAMLASAFSASGWIEGVIEGPSEAAMSDALKRAAGGYGERKTGVLLLGLARGQGTMIFHDVALPGAKSANIDHVVVGKSREGKPCAFIIDSKFYGLSRLKGNDPGEVTYDMATKGYVHRQGARTREIDQSINTALWGAETVQKVTGIEDVRVIMAIHNADVAPHLVFERRGVPVEVMSAWALVEKIETRLMSPKSAVATALGKGASPLSPLQQARVAQGLVSASTGQRPAVVPPLGLSRKGREFMSAQARQARGGGARSMDSVRMQEGAVPPPSAQAQPPMPPAAPRAPEVPQSPPPRASAPGPAVPQSRVEETPFEKADREFFSGDFSDWADDSPRPLPVPPAESAPERLAGLWQEMRNSTPAPLDDVPAEYHQIVRGTPLTLTSFSDEHGPTAQDVVAITGVCVGVPGKLFLWHCSPEGWKHYQNTGTPVFISTIEVDRIVVRGGGE